MKEDKKEKNNIQEGISLASQEYNQAEISKEIAELLRENNKYLRRYVSFKHVLLRGIATGLGGFLGATILISIIFAAISKISVVPIIGNFVAQIMEFLQTNYPSQTPF